MGLTFHDTMTLGQRHLDSGYKLDVQGNSTTPASAADAVIRYEMAAASTHAVVYRGMCRQIGVTSHR